MPKKGQPMNKDERDPQPAAPAGIWERLLDLLRTMTLRRAVAIAILAASVVAVGAAYWKFFGAGSHPKPEVVDVLDDGK